MTRPILLAMLALVAPLALCTPAGATTGMSWSTFLGGGAADDAFAVAADAGGDVVVVGSTSSTNYPVTAGAYQATLAGGTDVVITKLAADGTTVLWSTYLGGSGDDIARGVAIGPGGDVYVAGYTTSQGFPVSAGAWRTQFGGGVVEGFAVRLSSSGNSLVYSTFVGASWDDYPRGIAVDATGAATIAGFTNSMDFPVTSGVVKPTRNPSLFDGADGFVTKLNPAGSAAVYSTYLGTNSGTDEIMAVALDASGRATVTGWTVSSVFPTTANAYDRTLADRQEVFVTRLNATATGYVFSTFLGGTGYDEGYGIAVDESGATYVTGRTTSTDFPTTPGAPQTSLGGGSSYDAFLAKLSPNGSSLAYSTYLGGGGNDHGWAVAVHSGGQAAVTGGSESSNFPTTSGAYHPNPVGTPDAFMTVLNTSGTEMLYSTYLGSSGVDCANGVTFQPNGRVAVAGCTDNGGFPSTPDSYDPTQNGAGTDDIFVSNFEVGASGGNVAVGDLPLAEGWSVRVGPNPFHVSASVRLALDSEERIAIHVVDVQGRGVRQLADGRFPPGNHAFLWDGRDDRGGDAGVGVFFVLVWGPAGRETVRVFRIGLSWPRPRPPPPVRAAAVLFGVGERASSPGLPERAGLGVFTQSGGR